MARPWNKPAYGGGEASTWNGSGAVCSAAFRNWPLLHHNFALNFSRDFGGTCRPNVDFTAHPNSGRYTPGSMEKQLWEGSAHDRALRGRPYWPLRLDIELTGVAGYGVK